jgi:hypothetical protein
MLLTTTILLSRTPVQQARIGQCGHQLRGRGTGHAGTARQLVDRHLLTRDRA